MMNIIQINYPHPGYMTPRTFSGITDIIIHHSAGAKTQTPMQIDAEHCARGMAMIGYNFVILPNGDVCAGRPLNVVPAAAYGRNAESVNICLVGNFQSDDAGFTGPPSSEQMVSLKNLCIQLHHQLPTIVRTIGHRDVATMFYPNTPSDYSTACPGSILYNQLPSLRAEITKAMGAV